MRVWALCDIDDDASAQVPEKVGQEPGQALSLWGLGHEHKRSELHLSQALVRFVRRLRRVCRNIATGNSRV